MNGLVGGFLLVAIVGALLLALIAYVRFCVRDARRRGKSPVWVVLAAVLFFPWGLIAWLIFRPRPLDAASIR